MIRKSFANTHNYISDILEKIKVSSSEWQIGKSKVFLRNVAYQLLEDRRKQIIYRNAVTIQKHWKKFVCFKSYLRIKKAVLIIQHSYRGWKLRIRFLRMRRSAIIIQSRLRGVFAREVSFIMRKISKKRFSSINEKENTTLPAAKVVI